MYTTCNYDKVSLHCLLKLVILIYCKIHNSQVIKWTSFGLKSQLTFLIYRAITKQNHDENGRPATYVMK
jgi:hypothetical protein